MGQVDEMIQSLVRDLKPVAPGRALWFRAALWFSGALGSATLVAFLFHWRADLAQAMQTLRVLCQLFIFAVALTTSAVIVFRLALPGYTVPGGWKLAPVGVAAAIGFALSTTWGGLERLAWGGSHCSVVLLAVGFIPGLLMVMALRGLAPVNLSRTGMMVGLVCGLSGALGLVFHCSSGESLHLFAYHLLPIAVLTWVGAKAGHLVLRW
jgi:hypothetical protein